MNYATAQTAKFILEAESEEDVYDGIQNIDSSYFEKNLDWRVSNYAEPVIENVDLVPENSTDFRMNEKIQKRFKKTLKEIS